MIFFVPTPITRLAVKCDWCDGNDIKGGIIEKSLQQNSVGLAGLLAQSLGVITPELGAVAFASGVATQVGVGTPGAFVVALIGTAALVAIVANLARRVPHAGGLYAIVRGALGADAGFLAGWTMLALAMIFVPGFIVIAAALIQTFVGMVAPDAGLLASHWLPWAVLIFVIVFGLVLVGVRISAAALLSLTAIGMISLLILDVAILGKGGASGLLWSSLLPWSGAGVKWDQVALGVGVAVTGLAGAEAAVFLTEEARLPHELVPRAVNGSLLIAGAFMVLTTFAIVSGYGEQGAVKSWPSDGSVAVVVLSSRYLSVKFGEFLLLVLAMAGLTAAMGNANSCTRLLFSWGREGYLPESLGRTHPKFKTPHVAVYLLASVSAAIIVIGAIWQGASAEGAFTYFYWLAIAGTVGLLAVYGAVAVAGLVQSLKDGMAVWRAVMLPGVALLVLGTALVTQFYPAPAPPLSSAPYALVAWIIAGIVLRVATRAQMAARERGAYAPRIAEATVSKVSTKLGTPGRQHM